MSDTIWKYPILLMDRQIIALPVYAKILSVGRTRDGVFLWAKVSPALATNHAHEKHTILVAGTGNPMHERPDMSYEFLGTIIEPTSTIDLVWHIFEEKPL